MDDRKNITGDDAAQPAEGPDEAFARLQAADPAAGAAPRPGVLRAKVDDLRAAGGTAADEARADEARADGPRADEARADGPRADTAGTDEDDLAVRRAARRRRGSWLVAAGVAGAVAVGAGGYVLGGATAGTPLADVGALHDPESTSAAEPAITLGGPSARSGVPGAMGGELGGAENSAGAASDAGTAAQSSAAADIAYPGWYSGRALFTADGLGTARGVAEAYALDAREATTEDAVRRLAEALGVEGEPSWSYGSWSVGSQDGTSRTLWLSADGTASFSYSDPAADPWRCEGGGGDGVDATEDGQDEPAIQGMECPTASASEVSDREARLGLRELLTRIGVDADGYEIELQKASEGDPARWVVAHQVVDGTRSGVTVSATVGPSGIVWADGTLAMPTSIGTYPVVSEAEAVERLGDPRFASSVYPIALAEPARIDEPVDPGPGTPTPAPAPPSSGSAITWPVSDVTITEARLGLAQHRQEDGAVLLVPTYELRDAQDNAWSVIAVAEDSLDFAS